MSVTDEVRTVQKECQVRIRYVSDVNTCIILVDTYRVHRNCVGF